MNWSRIGNIGDSRSFDENEKELSVPHYAGRNRKRNFGRGF
jgi:hypothetical protein